MSNTPTRRLFLAAGPATAVFAALAQTKDSPPSPEPTPAPVADVSAIGGDDPFFAAIERHKRARADLNAVCGLTDEVLAEQEGRRITEADEAIYERASEVECGALRSLAATAPSTLKGLLAGLVYLTQYAPEEDSLETFIRTAAASQLLAGNGALS